MLIPGGGALSALAQPTPQGPLQKNSALLALLQNHPGLSPDFVQQILGGLGASIQGGRDQRQATRQDFRSTLSQLALQPGMTSDALQGYASAAYPNLADKPVGTNTLDALSGVIQSPGNAAGELTPEDHTNIPQLVLTQFQAVTDPSDPAQLQKVVDAVRQQAIALGKNDAGVSAAVDYAKLVLSRLTQQSRPELVNTLYPPDVPDAAPPMVSPPGTYTRFGGYGAGTV